MAVSKLLLSEFGIHYRLESCVPNYLVALKLYDFIALFFLFFIPDPEAEEAMPADGKIKFKKPEKRKKEEEDKTAESTRLESTSSSSKDKPKKKKKEVKSSLLSFGDDEEEDQD